MVEPRRGPAVWIATCGGVGYFPIAPGTAGSTVGLVLVLGLARAPLAPLWLSSLLALLTIGIFFLGVWSAGAAERHFGRVDPSPVVIDEVMGQLLTFLARPDASWKWLLAGFLLFRIFDIIKPFPASQAERLPGGWGIMADDFVAGLYSLAAISILGYLLR